MDTAHDAVSDSRNEIQRRNALLITDVELTRGAVTDGDSMRRSLRESVLYLLRDGDEGVAASDAGGIRWIYAFTSEREVALFAVARGAADAEVDYLTVRGDRLLDEGLTTSPVPTGIALDVAGRNPMLFPPLTGIVPDAAAVDTLPGVEDAR